MSSNSQVLNTGQQAITQYDFGKIFIRGNRYQKASYTNSTGGSVTLLTGTVLGKITATGKLLALKSDAVDGSQIPVGVLAQDATVANGVTVTLTYCNDGDVVADKLIFAKAGDSLTTPLTGGSMRDRIMADSAGIIVVDSTDLSKPDNQ